MSSLTGKVSVHSSIAAHCRLSVIIILRALNARGRVTAVSVALRGAKSWSCVAGCTITSTAGLSMAAAISGSHSDAGHFTVRPAALACILPVVCHAGKV